MTDSIFHILNGGSAAAVFEKAGIPGGHFAWREVLCEGPAPLSHDRPNGRLFSESVLRLRAEEAQRSCGVPVTQYLDEMEEQENTLHNNLQAQEMVLWFEADFFCQMNLIGLLSWLAAQPRIPLKLSLIYAEDFPGRPDFRGLGELDSTQLKTLYPKRAAVGKDLLQHAARFWNAYCSPDPSDLLKLKEAKMPAWIQQALVLHFRKFPSFETGVNVLEEQTLRLLAEKPLKIADLFTRFGNHPASRVYGLGDLQYWSLLENMNRLEHPLISIDGPPALPKYAEAVSRSFLDQWAAGITDFGLQVLEGAKDTVRENGIDRWLGGVHLSGNHPVWRWREDSQELSRK